MTREEAIKILQNICFEAPEVKEALQIAIEALSMLSLPSDLDEAAEEFVKTTSVKVWGKIDPKKDLKGYMARANYGTGLLDGFKAGAEWMVGQGQTIESLVWRDEDDKLFIEAFIDENKFKMADNIIIQIRKK